MEICNMGQSHNSSHYLNQRLARNDAELCGLELGSVIKRGDVFHSLSS